MAKRAKLDPFGLSVLDTVTCGLGGAIVILLYAAANASPGAPIAVQTQTVTSAAPEQPASGSQAPAEARVTGLVTVVFRGSSVDGLRVTDCASTAPLPAIPLLGAGRARDPALEGEVGVAVWAQSDGPNRLCVEVPAGATQVLSVVDGAFRDWVPVAGRNRLCFQRNPTDRVFDLQQTCR